FVQMPVTGRWDATQPSHQKMPQTTDLTVISATIILPGICTQWHIACFNPGEAVAGVLLP
ncbi:hypothetical protein, partial [Klebsiella michiganensis]|uniref:hypothetical protein n=1 Tax=Klebsiella michiganensis TaxID=1134687 RepID=UPI001954A0E7